MRDPKVELRATEVRRHQHRHRYHHCHHFCEGVATHRRDTRSPNWVCVCDVGPGGYRERVVTAVTAVVVHTLCDPTNGAPLPY